ncbi:hypothetical protein Hanom_Chr02g00159451 [Helianthus anomalus]
MLPNNQTQTQTQRIVNTTLNPSPINLLYSPKQSISLITLLYSSFRFQNLWCLPCEIGIFPTKMPVSRGFLVPIVPAPFKVKIDSHHTRPEVEVFLDQSKDIPIRDCSSFIRVNKHG